MLKYLVSFRIYLLRLEQTSGSEVLKPFDNLLREGTKALDLLTEFPDLNFYYCQTLGLFDPPCFSPTCPTCSDFSTFPLKKYISHYGGLDIPFSPSDPVNLIDSESEMDFSTSDSEEMDTD